MSFKLICSQYLHCAQNWDSRCPVLWAQGSHWEEKKAAMMEERRKHLIQPGDGRDMVREGPWGKRLWWQKFLYVFRFPKAVSSLFSLGTRLNYVSHPPLQFSVRWLNSVRYNGSRPSLWIPFLFAGWMGMVSKDLKVGGARRWEEPESQHHCSPNTWLDFMKSTTKLTLS